MRYVILILIVALGGCGYGTTVNNRSGGFGASAGPFQPGNQGPQNQQDQAQVLSTSGILGPNYQIFPDDPSQSQAFAQRFPVYTDSYVSYLHPGADFYNARMKLLDQATQSVRVQYLLFHGDESGWRTAEKLVQLKKRGIRINVIIDDLSNYSLQDQRLYFYLRNNDIIVDGWEFLFLNVIGSASQMNDFGIVADNANRRYHDKMFIVDGEDPVRGMAILGGANIGNNYFRVETDQPDRMWHDSEVLVKGPIVQKITQIFDENLVHFQTKRPFQGSSELLWAAVNALFRNQGIPDDLNTEYLARLDHIAAQPLALDWHNVPMRFIQSRPREREDYVYPVYVDMINSAQNEIYINNSYFVPDEGFIEALRNAARRGVKVHIMTNTKETIDFPHVVVVGRTLYQQILSINVEVGEERVFIYEWGGDRYLENGEGQNHSKYMVVDHERVIVGSYNIDPRSRWLNSETVLVYEGEAAVKPFADQFMIWTGPDWTLPISYEKSLTFDDPNNLKDAFDLIVGNMIKPYL